MRIENLSATQHALVFVLEADEVTLWDDTVDPDGDHGGRTYMFLSNERRAIWHGYVTLETAACVRYLSQPSKSLSRR